MNANSPSRLHPVAVLFGIIILTIAPNGFAQTVPSVNEEGVLNTPGMEIPYSDLASPEARQAYIEMVKEAQHPDTADHKAIFQWLTQNYPTKRNVEYLHSVRVEVFEPTNGVSPGNRNRVLIDLHGGGFEGGWGTNSLVESIPIAFVGRVKVISVDYREGPDHKYPAATEDVEAVYREVLKTYNPRNIGIYGCSAGGVLTAEVLAWFRKQHLPQPGAAGLFCGGAIGKSMGDFSLLGPVFEGIPSRTGRGVPVANKYFEGTDIHDALVSPAFFAEEMADFPPTLLISGTRDFALSSVVFTHAQLVKAGVDAELHVWEGMWHAAFYDPRLPESQEAYQVIVHFFDKHLGESSEPAKAARMQLDSGG